jgi:hypothetical protein
MSMVGLMRFFGSINHRKDGMAVSNGDGFIPGTKLALSNFDGLAITRGVV